MNREIIARRAELLRQMADLDSMELIHRFSSECPAGPAVQRMQYGTFRAAGYFIGSGVVEAGCKTVIGGRCKQSGTRWSKPGAEDILARRCIHGSRRLGESWRHGLDTRASRNDSLHLAA